MSDTHREFPPEIPDDATPDEQRWIKRQISEGGPVPTDDDPVATRTLADQRAEEEDAG
ncbi:MAG TPA: hypothetical protein PKM36_08925 [Propionibacteriaceae bacterium]|nr:hypothetical protein [Propionibacteriaceae bacterium]